MDGYGKCPAPCSETFRMNMNNLSLCLMIKLKQSDTKNVTFIVHMNVTFKLYQSQLQKPPAFVFMILILDLTYSLHCNINLEG